jgi:hypothetical protein
MRVVLGRGLAPVPNRSGFLFIMRRHVLRLAAAAAVLLPGMLLGTTLAAPAWGADKDSGVSTLVRPGTAINPLDARAAAAKSAGITSASLTLTAASWQSGTIPVGGSEYWTWRHAPARAVFAVSVAPVDVEQHYDCVLRVARTWYVKTPSNERQLRIKITNPAEQNQACQGKILLNWTAPGTPLSWHTANLSPGATASYAWKNANPAKVYLAGLNPMGATSANCAFEVISTSYHRQPSGQVQFRFTVKNIGSVTCLSLIQLAWLDTVPLPSSDVAAPQMLHPGNEGLVAWFKYPLSTNSVYVPGLSLSSQNATAACRIR